MFFLLQNLQVQHDDRKQGKEQCQRIEIHQQNPDIHKIKAQKYRIAAEFVNAACGKFGFVLAGNSGTPAVPHADDRGKENQISEDSRTKAGETSADRDIVPIEYDGEDLRERSTECGNAHKQFYHMYGFFLSTSDLASPDTVPMLNQYFGKIDPIEQHQNRKAKKVVWHIFFKWYFHIVTLRLSGYVLFP